jgi:hypothetical protein
MVRLVSDHAITDWEGGKILAQIPNYSLLNWKRTSSVSNLPQH